MSEFQISATNIFGILSLFTALLYLVQLFISKSLKERSSRIIVSYFALLSFIVFFFTAYDNGFENISKHLIPLLVFAVLTLSPSIYLYIKELTSQKQTNNNLKHYYLPIVFGSLAGIFHLLIGIEIIQKLYTYLVLFSISALFIGQSVLYIYQSLKTHSIHLQNIPNIFSYEENVKAGWVRVMVYGFIAFVGGLILVHIIEGPISDIGFDLLMLSYIAYTGFHALKQNTFYKFEPSKTTEDKAIEKQEEDAEEKTPVDTSKLETLKNQIIEIVESEKLYTDQEITIFDLAEKLNSNSKYVSQAINSIIGKSFIVFINEYRVTEAKQLLADNNNDHLTIEGIGQLAGFKSKSSFNTAFKKYTDVTPSQFKEKARSAK